MSQVSELFQRPEVGLAEDSMLDDWLIAQSPPSLPLSLSPMGGSPSVPTLLDDLPFNRLGGALLGFSLASL